MTFPIEFPGRRFQLWAYTVSHRQLLLRSNSSEQHASRCDVLFKNVAWVNLPTLIDDLRIEVAPTHELSPSLAELGEELSGRLVHLIRTRSGNGYVVAGSVTYAEDDGAYDDPSTLF